MDPRYSIIGLAVGILVGLTGVGGGSLMTPLLLLMHIKASTAVGTDLAYSAVMKAFGAVAHKKTGKVNMSLVWRLAIGSVPGSLVGAFLVHSLISRYGKIVQTDLTRAIGVMLVLVAISLLIRSLKAFQNALPSPKFAARFNESLLVAVPIGFIIGFLVGVTSIGAGAFFAIVFILIFGLKAHEIVATDVVHGMILAAAAAAAHVWTGDVNYPLVGQLLIGAVPGILIGTKLSTVTPSGVLRPTLASVLLISGLKVLVG